MVRPSKSVIRPSPISRTVYATCPRLQNPCSIRLFRLGSSSTLVGADAILNPLSQLLGVELELSVKAPKEGTKRVSTEGDAAIRVALRDQSHGTKVAIVAYVEFKSEIGLHGDDGLQSALSLRKHVPQRDVSYGYP
jgi:hypothetical protein